MNGRYLRFGEAGVHIEDRGLQFADSVYEVCEVRDGRLVDETRHLQRLERSLAGLKMATPVSLNGLRVIMREVIRRNRVRDGLLYFQVTRGTAPRGHAFPPAGTPGGLIVTARRAHDSQKYLAAIERGIKVVTVPDNRWERVDIKTVGLLPNVLAKQEAVDRGAYEAWFVDGDGYVTEGTSTNAWIVTDAGQLVTRPTTRGILPGVTRAGLVEIATELGIALVERPFLVDEAYAAREAFLSSSSHVAIPINQIDDHVIGDGSPGPVATQMRNIFRNKVEIGPKWAREF